jgi:hypothetical protein
MTKDSAGLELLHVGKQIADTWLDRKIYMRNLTCPFSQFFIANAKEKQTGTNRISYFGF